MNNGNKFEFKIDKNNGCFIGIDGCHYDNKREAMYYGQLKLCGCGRPEDVHHLIIDCLKQFATEDFPKPGVKAIEEIVKSKPDVVAEFIAHFLDQKNLTEHGGSVYGSWLTDRGKQFLEIGPMREEDGL